MALSAKQAAFAREYTLDKNATQAAIRAGYDFPIRTKGFYVYFLLDGEEIFYVGKGKGRRIESHRRDAGKANPVNPFKARRIRESDAFSERLFAVGLNEVDALALERDLIRKWRHFLTNVTGGNLHPVESDLIRLEDGLLTLRLFDDWIDHATDEQIFSAMDSHGTVEAFYADTVGRLLSFHEATANRLNLIKGNQNGARR